MSSPDHIRIVRLSPQDLAGLEQEALLWLNPACCDTLFTNPQIAASIFLAATIEDPNLQIGESYFQYLPPNDQANLRSKAKSPLGIFSFQNWMKNNLYGNYRTAQQIALSTSFALINDKIPIPTFIKTLEINRAYYERYFRVQNTENPHLSFFINCLLYNSFGSFLTDKVPVSTPL